MSTVKPGIKTTEFWSSVLLQLGIAVSAGTSNAVNGKEAIISAIVVNGLYIASRTLTKIKGAPSVAGILSTVSALLPIVAAGTPKTLAAVEKDTAEVAATEVAAAPAAVVTSKT